MSAKDWISVFVKPEKDGEYLIAGWFVDGGSFRERRIADFADGKWLRPLDDLLGDEDEDGEPIREEYQTHEITHWQPLPEVPEGA